jgi:Thioredoxin-like
MQKNGVSFREHRELGGVAWLRDYDRALALAAEQGKPILLLFQEVPGCSTCVRFGQDVLTHP